MTDRPYERTGLRAAQRIADEVFGKGEKVPGPRPARPVRMEVVMRWIRMKWPDGMSFSPLQEGFGWLPKIESGKGPAEESKGDRIIRLRERRRRHA